MTKFARGLQLFKEGPLHIVNKKTGQNGSELWVVVRGRRLAMYKGKHEAAIFVNEHTFMDLQVRLSVCPGTLFALN